MPVWPAASLRFSKSQIRPIFGQFSAISANSGPQGADRKMAISAGITYINISMDLVRNTRKLVTSVVSHKWDTPILYMSLHPSQNGYPIPRHLNEARSSPKIALSNAIAFPEGECSLKKLRPHTSDTLNQALESPSICEALSQAFCFQNVTQEDEFRLEFMWTSIRANSFTRTILAIQKHKPVVFRKILPIASFKPDSSPMITYPSRSGFVPLLLTSSTRLEPTDAHKSSRYNDNPPNMEIDPPWFSKGMSFISKLLELLPWRSKGCQTTEETAHFQGQISVNTADALKFKQNFTSRLEDNQSVSNKVEITMSSEGRLKPDELTFNHNLVKCY
ncbi:hypothetical protein BS47DRAFT_1369808 [Hydnum rufescens UP504]|uniref:Uncharacterized protein n=1 Tax=Hydnum rufescens UP504 TaxID=1448309 RepID=A0A9P6DLI0_9AGAM|nr:hypothetical protein BS47DRAFT_1369808 [Hydnum rufescens UP504]